MNQKQRGNLLKLAQYLEALPEGYEHFDMNFYVQSPSFKAKPETDVNLSASLFSNSCGTVACAAGHGPIAGIKPKKGEDWEDYVWRVFGLDTTSEAFDWCFAEFWRDIDNTPHGAAKRIKWFLKYGMPIDCVEQWRGQAPLCYLDKEAVDA